MSMQTTIFTARRLIPVAVVLAGFVGSARADELPAPLNEVRLGAYFISYASTASDLSGPFTPPGINLRVGDVTTPYLAYLRSVAPHWTLELAAGVPPTTHTYGKGPATVGSVPFDGQEVATAKWFSPSLLLEYKFLDPSRAFQPFVGAGINYTRFYDLNSTPAGDAANGGPGHADHLRRDRGQWKNNPYNAANGGPTRITLSSSIGPAATVGASYRITREISVMASYSVAGINSDYRSDTAGVVRTTTVHFNPRTWVAAVGYSF